MRLCGRLVLILLLLGSLAALQELQLRGAATSQDRGSRGLSRDLADFPRTLGAWRGQDIPTTRPEYLYGDAHVHRSYTDPESGFAATLWIAFSSVGEDRYHHPEVCMRASGHRELPRLRQDVSMGHAQGPAPAQHFVFEKLADRRRVHVVYWHYALNGQSDQRGLFSGQGLRHVRKHASVTVELFAHDTGSQDSQLVEQLAHHVDEALAGFLPPGARRSTDRGTFLMIRDAQWIEG